MGWHKASVSGCLPLAAPIGLSPLLILTLCGSERVLVVSTEPLDDLSCVLFDYSRVGCPGDGLLPVPLTRCIQMHTPSPCWVCRLQHRLVRAGVCICRIIFLTGGRGGGVGGSGRSAAGVPGGGGGGFVGTPTYVPQNDPHDVLIILNMHSWGNCFRQNLPISSGSRQPRSNVEVRSGLIFFPVFHPLLESPQNSTKMHEKFQRLRCQHFYPKSHIGERRVRKLWGVWGVSRFEPAAPPWGDG